MEYLIRDSEKGFEKLDLEIMDFIDSFPEAIDIPKAIHFDRHNIALADWWDTPETRFKQIDGTYCSTFPDITTWYCSCLILSPRANRLLDAFAKEVR